MEESKVETTEEEVEVVISNDVDATNETQTDNTVSTDDELDEYTKGVSKRVNKLNQRAREAEERAQYFEQQAVQKDVQINTLRNQTSQLGQNVLLAEEQSIESKEQQANELYKKAVDSGDAELMSKADTLKSDLSIQKEKLRIAKNRNNGQSAEQYVPYQEQTPQYERPVEPTGEAMEWAKENPWYGDQTINKNAEATQYAYFTHFNLINEGFEADSDDYYNELDSRVFKVYPELGTSKKADNKDGRPPVQRVASTSYGSRQKTQGKKNGVTFSKSEVERLRGLKPYNMSENDWLKQVAKEKQAIAQREAK
tara:strand:+ start:1351 stop:2283 length:933 start_codon:yes stop_codon:yes gene_type:complete